ncbi:hypothetical protein Clacol_000630 [Clathrus columnatus]|uniref:ubiquitinyl hydrolase 1 n=1 Tax=Clathrus columnatus TaxID=1419009 RepID=A0AAV4ZYZ6_9AGAM|nr:hypothetical protein Clacol_000630 [Clathrus columnatus]
MAGLEPLLPLIYHEKQQQGSQLCAQHALNAVLQGDYFQAPDLAQFAEQLDHLEGSVNEEIGPNSHNMDDTGFFSIGVLEDALRVWGFTNQMAFILNHQQHWFSLRRFGDLRDSESGHWFSLNSFLQAPEWVGKLYLGMMLSQAEDEGSPSTTIWGYASLKYTYLGYSVFAVRPIDEDPEAILPHTEADDVAMTLPQPTSAGITTRFSTNSIHTRPDASQNIPGFEDEDLELQAALQASLTAQDHFDIHAASTTTDLSSQSNTARLPGAFPGTHGVVDDDDDDDDDDVAATMTRNQARNKAIIERMKREQEMALRETYEDQIQNFGESSNGRKRQTVGEDEEEEALRRAIQISRSDSESVPYTPDNALGLTSDNPGTYNDRVYDDEDSELQAALKASLEGLPEGFVIPSTPPEQTATSSGFPSTIKTSTVVGEPARAEEPDESEPIEVNAEELRRRRLARFGGN